MLFYKKNNWNLFNKAKPGNLGGTIKKWSKNKLQKEANKYKTRSEFANNSHCFAKVEKDIEMSSKRNRILDILCRITNL